MSEAIVLNITRYSDTGSVVHLYTTDHGRMQFVVYGNKLKGLLRPLNILPPAAIMLLHRWEHYQVLPCSILPND